VRIRPDLEILLEADGLLVWTKITLEIEVELIRDAASGGRQPPCQPNEKSST
jgi:hypothetical protein